MNKKIITYTAAIRAAVMSTLQTSIIYKKIKHTQKTSQKDSKRHNEKHLEKPTHNNQMEKIEYWRSIHDTIYNNLKINSDNILKEKIILDTHSKNKLSEIKNKIDLDIKNQNNISYTMIQANHTMTNKDEFKAFYIFLKNHKNKTNNCASYSDQTQVVLNDMGHHNIRIKAKPDHAFNLFLFNNKAYFYDSWGGGTAGEFTPEFFYENCDLGGIYNIGYHIFHEMQISNKYVDENNSVKVSDVFDKAIEKIKDAKNDPKIKKIVESRLKSEINKIDKNDLFYEFKIININKIAEEFKIEIKHSKTTEENIKKCRSKLRELKNELKNERPDNIEYINAFFNNFMQFDDSVDLQKSAMRR